MRIGIITIFKSINYGAILQATALNRTITNMGHSCEIINYLSPNHRPGTVLQTSRTPLIAAYRISTFPIRKILEDKFADFRRRNLPLSKYYDTNSEIAADLNNWDKIVCGSDQIWNLPAVGLDTTFMLDFVYDTRKKISYAPSIGLSHIPEPLVEVYKKHLSSFKWLSVREETGAKLIKEACGLSAKAVLDPTLLLNSEEWLSISSPIKVNRPYIFVYTASDTDLVWRTAKKLAEKTGCRVISANRGYWTMLKSGTTSLLSPSEFISYLAGAAYVVTNSFHGTAFAINLNKNFFVSVSKKRGPDISSRIFDIMENTCLSNRIIEKNPEILNKLDLPDFTSANNYLKHAREYSLEYLRSSLES